MVKELIKLPKEIQIKDTEMLGVKVIMEYTLGKEKLSNGLYRMFYVCRTWQVCMELVESYHGFDVCEKEMLRRLNHNKDNNKENWVKVKY